MLWWCKTLNTNQKSDCWSIILMGGEIAANSLCIRFSTGNRRNLQYGRWNRIGLSAAHWLHFSILENWYKILLYSGIPNMKILFPGFRWWTQQSPNSILWNIVTQKYSRFPVTRLLNMRQFRWPAHTHKYFY